MAASAAKANGAKLHLQQPFSQIEDLIADPAQDLTAEDLQRGCSMRALNNIHEHLWFAGTKGHIATIHHQHVLLRTVVPTQLPRLHLVWFHRTIYIMPMPDCLLNSSTYTDIICTDFDLCSDVIGFIRSYCHLIQYPIDLTIAQESHHISNSITWKQWAAFRKTVLAETEHSPINKRYEYGELRLHRLDLIYRLTGRGLTYFTVHREYQTYFGEYLAIFVTIFAFVATILTAMQVLVGIDSPPAVMVTVCYRFSVAVLIGICACFGYIGLAFVSLYSYNFLTARFPGAQRKKDTRFATDEGAMEFTPPVPMHVD